MFYQFLYGLQIFASRAGAGRSMPGTVQLEHRSDAGCSHDPVRPRIETRHIGHFAVRLDSKLGQKSRKIHTPDAGHPTRLLWPERLDSRTGTIPRIPVEFRRILEHHRAAPHKSHDSYDPAGSRLAVQGVRSFQTSRDDAN
jgi:hypothetical protein